MSLIIYYVPCPNLEFGRKLVQQLLSARLIACGNLVQSESMYIWQGSMSNESEWIAILKSVAELSEKLESFIKDIHPYETPAIISWVANCNLEYLLWVKAQVDI
jgi:periplasmic divalent cation tolerance protein